MDIEIKINHFGPLSNITLHWAPFMIITGHSNLGKSYANYLIYYAMSGLLNDRFREMLEEKLPEDEDKGEMVLSISDIETYLNSNVQNYMRSFLDDDLLECDVEFKLDFSLSEFRYKYSKNATDVTAPDMPLKMYGTEVNGQKSFGVLSYKLISYSFWFSTIRNIFGTGAFMREVLLPPGRGAFVGEDYSTKVSSSLKMYNEYFHDYDFGQIKDSISSETNNNDIRQIISSFIGGEFVSEKSKQFILLPSGKKMSLTAAASSIKEISPLLYYFFNKNESSCFSYCLEEPEAHLHPCSQIKIADLIASFLNKGNMFQITTHSDYFLQRINQLIKLGDIRNADEEAFEKLCDERGLLKSSYIDRSKVKAYFFHKNAEGKVEVEDMPLTQDGISYKTFYDITRDLNEREEYINEQLYKLNEK